MGHRYRVQPSGTLVVVVFEGEITEEEERLALLEYTADPAVDLTADVLVDRTRATMQATKGAVERQLDLVQTNWPTDRQRPRMAIIVPRDPDYGILRMLELRGGDTLPHQLMVVRTLEEACEYLDILAAGILWP